jgi:hypothetical protein
MRISVLTAAAVACITVGAVSGATASTLVTGAQVKNGSLSGKDVKDRSLSAADFAAGVRGAAGAAGAAGLRAADPGYQVTFDPAHLSESVPPMSQKTVVFSCPAGHTALGGAPSSDARYVVDSHHVAGAPSQWTLGFDNVSGATLHPVLYLYCTT